MAKSLHFRGITMTNAMQIRVMAVAVLFGLAMTCSNGHCGLVLNVDSDADMVYFTGNATGTTDPFTAVGSVVEWRLGTINVVQPVDMPSSNPPVTATSINYGSGTLSVGNNGPMDGSISVFFMFDGISQETTLTSTGNMYDYSGLSADLITILENAATAEEVLTLYNGSDFGGLSMQKASVIPEPSAFLCLGLVALCIAGWNRWKPRAFSSFQ